MINFVYQAGGPYSGVLDAFIEPILEHLPATKGDAKAGALNVSFFVGKNSGAFIPHGIADKGYRNANKLRGFDYVFVSGPAWVEKLTRQGFPKEKVKIGGYSKLDPVFRGEYKRTPGEKPRILYAPTHGAIEEVSLHGRFDVELMVLSEHYEVISSAHPTTRSDKNTTMQALVDADVVIADSGSILYEAWALGKPVVFPDWLIKEGIFKYFPGSFEEQIYQEEIGYHAKTLDSLLKTVELALRHGIDQKTKQFIDGIFPPELRGRSGEAIANILREMIE